MDFFGRLGHSFTGFLDHFLPEVIITSGGDVLRRARFTLFLCFISFGLSLLAGSIRLYKGWYLLATFSGALFFCSMMGVFLLSRFGSLKGAGNLLISGIFLIIISANILTGAKLPVMMLASCLLPLVSVSLLGIRNGVIWGLFTALGTIVAIQMGMWRGKTIIPVEPQQVELGWRIGIPVMILVFLLFGVIYEQLKNLALQDAAKAQDALSEANEAKSQFLSTMSHELRTPLNAIIGYSELLQEDAKNAEMEGFEKDVRRINTAGRHLLELIDDVLDLSKIEAGKMELECSSFELNKLFDEIDLLMEPLYRKHNNSFSFTVNGSIGTFYTDRQKLKQNVLNLLSNASKFSVGKEVDFTVSVEQLEGREWLICEVEDRGKGMSVEQVEQIFLPFTQADLTIRRKFGGTGLGLTITHHFCQLMEGEIQVKSEEGKGSLFTMKLPNLGLKE